MEFSIKSMAKIAGLMAEEVRKRLGEEAQIGEIEQALREL